MASASPSILFAPPTPRELRTILGAYPTGVTVLTSRYNDAPYGMTANSFTSVSLNPALVLVCLRRRAKIVSAINREKVFGINVLDHGQEHVARHFADPRRPTENYRFDESECRFSESGVPYVRGALVQLECGLHAMYPGGDHVVCIGEVLGTRHVAGQALAFVTGRFTAPLKPGLQPC